MTPETSNAIVAVGTIILALCAIAALAFKFWTSPKPVESKIAILRGLVEFSCIAAVVIAGYSLTATHKLTIALAFICALYNFLVQVALFALWPNPVLRRDVLSLVFATAFLAIIPTLATTGALARGQSVLAEAQAGMLRNDEKIVSVLEKLVGMPTPSPSPTPSPTLR